MGVGPGRRLRRPGLPRAAAPATLLVGRAVRQERWGWATPLAPRQLAVGRSPQGQDRQADGPCCGRGLVREPDT